MVHFLYFVINGPKRNDYVSTVFYNIYVLIVWGRAIQLIRILQMSSFPLSAIWMPAGKSEHFHLLENEFAATTSHFKTTVALSVESSWSATKKWSPNRIREPSAPL